MRAPIVAVILKEQALAPARVLARLPYLEHPLGLAQQGCAPAQLPAACAPADEGGDFGSLLLTPVGLLWGNWAAHEAGFDGLEFLVTGLPRLCPSTDVPRGCAPEVGGLLLLVILSKGMG